MENTTNRYIVSLDNGIREEEPITMVVFNNFSDGSKLVQLNNNVFGVYKENSLKPETTYIDDYDIIKSDIAELFDIDHEVTRRIVDDERNIGVFTELNYRKNIETRISATTVLNHLVTYVNNNQINSDDVEWVASTFKIQQNGKGSGTKDPKEIENILNLGLYGLSTEIELQSGVKINKQQYDTLKKHYIRMILFDLITGRKYRGVDYYLISGLNDNGKPLYIDARLAPISTSGTIEKEKLVADNEYFINNKYINKEALMNVLYDVYYRALKKPSEALNDASRLYRDAIARIIYNNTDIDEAQSLEEQILDNLARFNKKQKDKEKILDADQKTNKVERTMATQSLNVRVTGKLDLIQKKYPLNPKDHPELRVGRKKKQDKKENVKLVVEEEINKKTGFANAAILISVIALLCGIGLGIAYVLLVVKG